MLQTDHTEALFAARNGRPDDVVFNPATGRMEPLTRGVSIFSEPPKPEPVKLTGRWVEWAEEQKQRRDYARHFDRYQFRKRTELSSALDFAEFKGKSGRRDFQVFETTRDLHWRTGIPPFGRDNPELLKLVLVTYLERRFYLGPAPRLSVEERIERAQSVSKGMIEQKQKMLDRLIKRYQLKPTEANAREVVVLDTDIVMLQRGIVELVSRLIYLSYTMMYDSTEVAEELQLKPPHVRQILFRLMKTWQLIEKYDEAPPLRRP